MDATVTFKDGSTHTYQGVPDGTTPDIVEAQALKEFGKPVASLSSSAAVTPPDASIMGRIKNALIAPKEERDATFGDAVANGIAGVPEEIGKQFNQSIAAGVRAMVPQNGSDLVDTLAHPIKHLVEGVAGLAGAVSSPATGALTSAIGRPVEQQTGVRREVTGNVLSMAVPFAGELKGAGAATEAAAIKPYALEAHQAGYVLPPKMISDKPGLIANTMAGWSGKIKTAQAASAKNQEVTNTLAAKALGLADDAALDAQTFKAIRTEAGKAYSAIPKVLPHIAADDEYLAMVSDLGGASADAAKSFPGISKNQGIIDLSDELKAVPQFPTEVGLEVIKKLRTDAVANLKNYSDASKVALGKAQRTAANAMEDLIQRNLTATGDEQLVKDYQAARKQIAKSYDVEAATNPATGNVDARKLAALKAKGKPLTGELDTIANVATAFPKAFQSADKFGEVEPIGVLDMGAAALATAHGNPGIGLGMLTRPIARGLVLSKPVQNALAAERGATNVPLSVLKAAPAVNALHQFSQQNQ